MADGTVLLSTLDGFTLVGDIDLVPGARAAAVLAHPHPQFGGDRQNAVIDLLFRALPRVGVAVLRFDFRGVGRSEGTHGDGIDERLDVVAAIDVMAQLLPDLPLLLIGYSFGALVTLDVTDARVAGWLAVAPPLGAAPTVRLAAADHRRKLVLGAEHDQFTSPDALLAATASWASTRVEVLAMADHFLAGALGAVQEHAVAFVDELAGTSA
jgi:alpha/beta superfamily hydrolase